jgi:protein SCO1
MPVHCDSRRKHSCRTGALLLGGFLALNGAAHAQMQAVGVRPELLRDVGIDQKLNNQVPLNLEFRDEKGHVVQLGKYFQRKPVILSLVYYQCPMLCTQVLNGLLQGLKDLPMDVGKEFEVITVSIDPRDNTVEAEAKQIMYAGLYGRPGAVQGWHFLTGKDLRIHELADAVGFRYAFDSQSGQYAHASAIMLLTPEGKVSRYFYGIDFPARELRLGLVEASANKIGSPVDQILLYCYHYDPVTGKYGLVIANVLRAAAAFTVLAIGLLVFFLTRSTHYPLPGNRA